MATAVSERPLKTGSWTRLQVVYDLRTLTLYVNGDKVASVDAPCRRLSARYLGEPSYVNSPEFHTYLMVGAEAEHYSQPKFQLKGDLRNLRIYGRNLSPSEFLK